MTVWQASIIIAAPPEAVFDYLAAIERHMEWSGEQELGLLSLERTSSGPVGTGTTWRSAGKNVFGNPNQDESVITVFERPSKLEYETTWQLGEARLRFDHIYELKETGAGTEVTHRVERIVPLNAEGEPFAQVALAHIDAGNAAVAEGLERFAAHCC